jgi:hypothetical protein
MRDFEKRMAERRAKHEKEYETIRDRNDGITFAITIAILLFGAAAIILAIGVAEWLNK